MVSDNDYQDTRLKYRRSLQLLDESNSLSPTLYKYRRSDLQNPENHLTVWEVRAEFGSWTKAIKEAGVK